MRLRAIQPGDVVLVDKRGRRFEATVQSIDGGKLAIVPLDQRVSYYTARAREVRKRLERRRGQGSTEPVGER